ncbi:hypothetical protein O6H91_06G071700 [Diphasiastrum complanatum]|uniref:Uncharacterized protein n=1 Tax=Diphasiastrum complanatum TaxID=34168 RepID=A0ACC2DEW6_DIPCM|nr:hypothetical protein O6H91_06G071700 [Diphasiastrum complanatum]
MASKLVFREVLRRSQFEARSRCQFPCPSIGHPPSRHDSGPSWPSCAAAFLAHSRMQFLPYSNDLANDCQEWVSSSQQVQGQVFAVPNPNGRTHDRSASASGSDPFGQPFVQDALKCNLRFGSRFEQDSNEIMQSWKGFEAILQRLRSEEEEDPAYHKLGMHRGGQKLEPNIYFVQNSLKTEAAVGSRFGSEAEFHVSMEKEAAKWTERAVPGGLALGSRKFHVTGQIGGFSGALPLGGGFFGGFRTSQPQLVRYVSSGSTVADGLHEETDSIQAGLFGITDSVTDVVAAASSSSAGLVGEVATAAADSAFPIAALQHLIEAVHLQAGLPWWGSIVVATILVRTMTFPIVVYQMRATARLSGYDPQVAEENQKRLKNLFKKHNTSPFTPLLGGFVQAPIFMCFFFAISNMAEKVPSFKEGGTLWFTDLSTPDDMYIMPVLTALIFWITVELGAADGMQGQPNLEKMKTFLRALAVLMIPLTMSFPKALFCYWMTSNLFSLVQSTVLKQGAVKKLFGIPDVSHLASKQKTGPQRVATYLHPPKRTKKSSMDGGFEEKK